MADDGPLSWRSDIAIPELGVKVDDVIVLRPDDPDRALTIVRHIDRDTLTRYHRRFCARASIVSWALGVFGAPPFPPPPGPRGHLRVLH